METEIKKQCTRCNKLEGDINPDGNEVIMATPTRCKKCKEYDVYGNPRQK